MKRVFAPPPRSEKAHQIDIGGLNPDAMATKALDEVFKRLPSLEKELTNLAQAKAQREIIR